MKMLMYDPRFSAIERLVVRRANAKSKNFSSNGARPLSASFNLNSSSSNSSSGNNSSVKGNGIGGPSIMTPGQMLKQSGSAITSTSSPSSSSSSAAAAVATTSAKPLSSFMWGMFQCGDEITFLLEEDDVAQFPPGALQIVPQQW